MTVPAARPDHNFTADRVLLDVYLILLAVAKRNAADGQSAAGSEVGDDDTAPSS